MNILKLCFVSEFQFLQGTVYLSAPYRILLLIKFHFSSDWFISTYNHSGLEIPPALIPKEE